MKIDWNKLNFNVGYSIGAWLWAVPRKISRGLTLALALLLVLFLPLSVVYLSHHFWDSTETGLEILRLLFSWPLASIIIAIVVLTTLRDPIGDWLRGIKRIKGPGFDIEHHQQSEVTRTEKDPRKNEISWDDWAREVAETLSIVDREIISQRTSEQLTPWVKAWWFEKIWGQIYGTQIDVLEYLVKKVSAVPLSELNSFFEEHLRRYSQINEEANRLEDPVSRNAYFLRYIGFLESFYLVQRSEDTIQSVVLASEFLQYLTNQKYTAAMRML